MSDRPRRLQAQLPLLYPAAMLLVFFLVPFGIMVAFSFFHRIEGGFYEPAFELTNYQRFFSPLFTGALWFSLGIAALTAAAAVAVGLPFTYLLTRRRRRVQERWLVFILAVLSLSEVIIGFAWSVLLSRSAGLGNWLFYAGILERPVPYAPGFGGLLAGLVFAAFPYTVLVLYPPVSRLAPEVTEAARTLGASPLRTFLTVVVPQLRPAIVATMILVFVYALGSYLLPQLLGRPEHWTLSVLITDQAILQSNLPFAAAIAVFLMVVSLAAVVVTQMLGRQRR